MELGKSSGDAKGKSIRVIPEMRNTDAPEDGGSTCNSVEAPVTGVEPRGRHSKTGGHHGQLRNQEEPQPLRKGIAFAKGQSDRYEAPYEARVSRTVL